jgi:hypothetical protein
MPIEFNGAKGAAAVDYQNELGERVSSPVLLQKNILLNYPCCLNVLMMLPVPSLSIPH